MIPVGAVTRSMTSRSTGPRWPKSDRDATRAAIVAAVPGPSTFVGRRDDQAHPVRRRDRRPQRGLRGHQRVPEGEQHLAGRVGLLPAGHQVVSVGTAAVIAAFCRSRSTAS